MTGSTYSTEALIKAARAAAVVFIATLDEATKSPGAAVASTEANAEGLIEYDPLHDAPPFTANPQKGAPEQEQQMAWVTYLGAIGRINAVEGRGATSKEVSEFAKKAGYSGGNAVNGWNSRIGSPRGIELVEGGRFLNDKALGWIKKDAQKLGLQLVGDFKTVSQSE
jgi:hypothetical protein